MKLERSKNATRNIIYGIFLKIYQIIFPFVLRTVIMYELGAKYLGLNSLFTSVLHVLNLAELGIGSAMVFSMYRPIVEDNADKIKAYMRLYKIYYRIIGCVILVCGLFLTPFIPKLISGAIPENINIYILYLLNLLATVLSYWLFSYRKSIFQAHQRNDIVSKVTLVTDTIKYVVQILVLILFHNYYYFVITILFTQALNNIATAILSQKIYPQYSPEGKLEPEEVKNLNRRIRDLFTSRLGGTVVTSVDTIVISAFLGLEILAKYQNYYYIMNAVIGFMTIIHSSIVAGVGNSLFVKSQEQNKKEFHTFTYLIAWLSSICISCFLVLYQPFMKIWMGSEMQLSYGMVILFCIYFWTLEIVKMISVYKDAAGIWHRDRYRPLVASIVNLCLNLLLVRSIGLYGIVLSTIISVVMISIPWIVKNVFTYIFQDTTSHYFQILCNYSIGILLIGSICYFIASLIPDKNVLTLLIKGLFSSFFSCILFILIYKHSKYFYEAKSLLLKMLKIKKHEAK